MWIAIGEKFAWDMQSRSNGYVRHKHKRVIVYIYYVTLLRGVSLDFNTDEKKQAYTNVFQLEIRCSKIVIREIAWESNPLFDLNSFRRVLIISRISKDTSNINKKKNKIINWIIRETREIRKLCILTIMVVIKKHTSEEEKIIVCSIKYSFRRGY